MGAIEDTRKVLQDFLAPELRAISARLDSLEKRVDGIDKKIDEVDCRSERRHDEVLAAIRQLADFNSIQQRFTKLESQQLAHK